MVSVVGHLHILKGEQLQQAVVRCVLDHDWVQKRALQWGYKCRRHGIVLFLVDRTFHLEPSFALGSPNVVSSSDAVLLLHAVFQGDQWESAERVLIGCNI